VKIYSKTDLKNQHGGYVQKKGATNVNIITLFDNGQKVIANRLYHLLLPLLQGEKFAQEIFEHALDIRPALRASKCGVNTGK
jgi:hypothetical protein